MHRLLIQDRHLIFVKNVKYFLFMAYIVLPIIFYGIPSIWMMAAGVDTLTFHWFATISAESSDLIIIFLRHFIIGVQVFFILVKIIDSNYISGKNNSFYLSVCLMILGILPQSVAKTLLFLTMIFLLSRVDLSSWSFLMAIIISAVLLFWGDRGTIISLTICLTMILARKLSILFLIMILSMLLLVFVMQPLKAGLNPYIFFLDNGFSYFVQHLQPIYLSSIFHYGREADSYSSILEMLPLARSVFEIDGGIEAAKNFSELNQIDGDFGSNTSSYGFAPLVFVSIWHMLIYFIIRRFKLIFSAVLFYYIYYAPFFIRRAYGAYINDLVILIVISFIFYAVLQFLRYDRTKRA